MGDETRKQNRVYREIQEKFRARSDLSTLIDRPKTEISKIISVFRSEIAWPDETRHQFCPVPELAETGFEPHTGGITWRAYTNNTCQARRNIPHHPYTSYSMGL